MDNMEYFDDEALNKWDRYKFTGTSTMSFLQGKIYEIVEVTPGWDGVFKWEPGTGNVTYFEKEISQYWEFIWPWK